MRSCITVFINRSAIADLVGWVDERKPNISTQKISPLQNELTPLFFNLLGCVPEMLNPVTKLYI